ncbi:MAG: B12-binding domain-containing radical SAM protein [Polyangiaceae bacterium]|nr:B12-binding domain-containing radical SAM protein [Polyangiaceae bacterium]
MRALFVVNDLVAAEPLGVMQLASVLRHAGHPVCLAGARQTPLAPLLTSFRPQLIGYSAITGLHRPLLELNRRLKQSFEFFALFGGPHATFFPEMVHEPGVDAVCIGEGEGAVLDVASALDSAASVAGVANLWVKTAQGVVRAPPRPLIADLDALPFPDRSLRSATDPRSRSYPVKSILAARGCPFRCSYCFNDGYARLYGPAWSRVRIRSVGKIIAEALELCQQGPLELVQFRESVFPWQDHWLEQLAARWPTEVGLPFYCHVRADLLTPRRVALLARAGCVSVNLGIECGDETVRRELLERPISDDQMLDACRWLHASGIRVLADNMLGLPGTTLETDLNTLRLNQRCKVDYALAMLFQPYPGTRLGELARATGQWVGDLESIGANYYLQSPLRLGDARAQRVRENLQKWFAVLVEAPGLERLVRPLLRLPPNLVFLSIFRAWYTLCYVLRIVPHRLDREELAELGANLFGIFPPDANRDLLEQTQ